MASNAKNLAELLNQDTTVAAGDVAAGSITTDKLANNAVTVGKLATSGTLPAFNGSALTGVGGVKNLLINGDFQVAQRGASTTSGGYFLDMFKVNKAGPDISATQHALSTTDTPYSLGFRNSLQLHVTNPQSPDAAADYAEFETRVEARNITTSGWNYTSASSKITLSFWVLSTVAGTYTVYIRSLDTSTSSNGAYSFNYTLSANTWTKVTHTLPGHANLVFNNDDGPGLVMYFTLYYGTNYTGTVTNEQWRAHSGSAQFGDYAQNILATDESKFEITGVQLEVGDIASDFEHRSYGEELLLCQRYFYRRVIGIYDTVAVGHALGNKGGYVLQTPVPMRNKPAVTQGSNIVCWYNNSGSVTAQENLVAGYMATNQTDVKDIYLRADGNNTVQTGFGLGLSMYHGSETSSHISLSSEL